MERIIDIQVYLSTRLSGSFIDNLVDSIHQHPEDFALLYGLIASADTKISWRAAWACEKLSMSHSDWFIPRREELIRILTNCAHEGTKRELLSILHNLPQAQKLPVDLLNYCMEHMLASDEAIAVQALCIKLAYNLCLIEPELLGELKAYLENTEPELYSPAVQATIKMILKKINRKRR